MTGDSHELPLSIDMYFQKDSVAQHALYTREIHDKDPGCPFVTHAEDASEQHVVDPQLVEEEKQQSCLEEAVQGCMQHQTHLTPVSKLIELQHVGILLIGLSIPVLNEHPVIMEDGPAVFILLW